MGDQYIGDVMWRATYIAQIIFSILLLEFSSDRSLDPLPLVVVRLGRAEPADAVRLGVVVAGS